MKKLIQIKMKIVRVLGILLPAIFLPLALEAQNDSIIKFSLKEAQDYAIQNFYISKNAKLDVEKAKKVVLETTAIGLPQVKASASWTYIPGTIPTIDFGSSMMDIFGPLFYALDSAGIYHADPNAFSGGATPIAEKSTITYGFTVSQLIFSGEYIVGLQASRVYKSLSEEINDKTEVGLKESVANGYFSILILQKNRSLLEKMLENIKIVSSQSDSYYKAGFMESTDVDQIDLMVLSTENSLKTIDRQIVLLNKLFSYQLGMTSPTSIELTDNLDELIALNTVNDSAYDFNLEDNIDYQMLDTQEKLMKLNLNRQRTKYLPTVAGFYQYQDKNKKPAFDFTMKHLVGVSVEVPIIGSGSRIATTSQARIEFEKAQNTKDQEILRIEMEAEQAIYNYRTALEKYQNEKLAFELAEKIYEKTNEKYKQGVTSSLDLTTINNQFLQSQITYAAAIQELLSAKVKLDKAYNKL
jgi:outer membrane protein